MAWERSSSMHTTASTKAVWKRHVTAADWVADDGMTKAASFAEPPRTGEGGTVTGSTGKTKFTFTEVTPTRRMTQEFKLPGARLTLGHELEPDTAGLRLTHTVRLDGPLAPIFILIVGLSLARSRPGLLLRITARALAEDEAMNEAHR